MTDAPDTIEILVLSGKGGTGKTSVTAALAATGPAKLLADCDVDAADLHLVLGPQVRERHDFYSGELARIDPDACTECGLCAEKCRFDAIDFSGGAYQVVPTRCEGCGMCAFVCPANAVLMDERLCGEWNLSDTRHGTMVHARLGAGEENSGKLVTTVRLASREHAGEAKVILTDGPPGIGCPVIASLTNTDLVLLVAEPTRSALHDVRRVRELAEYFKIPCLAVVNKVDINPDLADEVEKALIAMDVPVIARLGYDALFTEAQINEQAVTERAPERYVPVFEDIWRALLDGARPANDKEKTS